MATENNNMSESGSPYLMDMNQNFTTTMVTQSEELDSTQDPAITSLQQNIDDLFHITMGCFVFFMQPGFAFLEAGSVRSKNTVNIIMKNILDILVGGIMYWACGWALAHGSGAGSGFAGSGNFFAKDLAPKMYPVFFFDYMFASTAITIVSGSIAERCPILAYMIYSVVISGWVYPISAHWLWGRSPESTDGWLYTLGCHDFAGSGGVHLLGGTAALVGCYLIRPRKGRFTEDGTPVKIPGHSMPLSALGGFFLVIGFLAFNGGTKCFVEFHDDYNQVSITGDGDAANIGVIILNTLLGGCTGGLSVLLLCRVTIEGKWSYHLMLNGMLTGIIAQCAGCDRYLPTFSAIIGVLGGLVYLIGHKAMVFLKLDDPLDAVAVHAGGGLLGVIVEPFFEIDEGIFYKGDTLGAWRKLGVNLLGAISIIAWSGFWSFLVFGILKSHNLLRVDETTEVYGHDLLHHGEAAYPLDAWLEYQYETQPTEKSTLVDQMMKKLRHLGNDAPADNSVSKDAAIEVTTVREASQDQLEVSARVSADGKRNDSYVSTMESIANFMSNSFRARSNRPRQVSSVSNLTSSAGEMNLAYIEDASVHSTSRGYKKPSTVSSTTQTAIIDCVNRINAKDSLDISDMTSSDDREKSEDRKTSFDSINLRSIIV